MTELSLRPRSATELVDAAFQIFRRNPTPFVLASAVIYIPWLIINAFINTITAAEAAAAHFEPSRIIVSSLITVVVYSIAGGVVMLLARDVYLDRPLDVGGAFRDLTRNLIPLVIATLLLYVFLVFGLVLFVFPVFYVLARFFAVRPAVVIEGAGIGKAFSRSSELSMNSKWHILGTLVLAGVVMLTVSIGASMLISAIPSRVIAFLVSAILSVTVYPFVSIVEVLLYYDMRIRKEGFDIEYLSGVGMPAGVGGQTP
jgi:hypothetical protein